MKNFRVSTNRNRGIDASISKNAILFMIAVALIVFPNGGFAENKRFSGDGISFEYPEQYKVTRETAGSSKKILVKDRGNSVTIVIYGNELRDGAPEEIAKKMEDAYRARNYENITGTRTSRTIEFGIKDSAERASVDADEFKLSGKIRNTLISQTLLFFNYGGRGYNIMISTNTGAEGGLAAIAGGMQFDALSGTGAKRRVPAGNFYFKNRPLLTKNIKEAHILEALYCPGGKIIASINGDNTVKIFNAKTGGLLKSLSGHANTLAYISFSGNGSVLATAALSDDPVKIWDTESGKLVKEIKAHPGYGAICLSPDGSTLATSGGLQGNDRLAGVILWDVRSGRQARVLLEDHPQKRFAAAIRFSPDGKFLAAGLSNDNPGIMVWEVQTGKRAVDYRSSGNVTCMDFSPDGKFLALGVSPGKTGPARIQLLDARNFELVRSFDAYKEFVTSLSFHPSGRFLASSTFGIDSRFKLWDTATGELIQDVDKKNIRTKAVSFSPDGNFLAATLITYGDLFNPPVLEIYGVK